MDINRKVSYFVNPPDQDAKDGCGEVDLDMT